MTEHKEKPPYPPYCCAYQAKWVVISPRLAYFYCEQCHKEVASEHNTKPHGQKGTDEKV